ALHEGVIAYAASGEIVASNPRAQELLGLSAEQLVGRTPLDPRWRAIQEDGSPWDGDQLPTARALRTGRAQLGDVVGVHTADGEPSAVLRQVQDISDRRRHDEQLHFLAHHDTLTGLLNRRGFTRELDRHASHAERYGPDGALLVFDLDSFKHVNDTCGHEAGDDVITGVAEVMRRRLRASDVLARFGGDEFAVLIPRG